jgi:hypothetical protein
VAACSLAYLKRSIDRAEAEMLGFPVKDASEQIERPIDAPAQWVAQASEGGGPATGYERETRIRGTFKVESYDYLQLDPERCDGSVCTVDGGETEQAPCPERYLMMRVSGDLETLDGAISVRFLPQPVNVRRPEQSDDVVVAASADLGEARGSLMIDPDVPPPRVGRIELSLQFADSSHRAYGVLSVSVFPDWDNLPQGAGRNIPSRFARYAPIEARWGDQRDKPVMVSTQ